MFSCKKAAQLCSKSQDVPLSFTEKLNLRFHMIMCKACRNFDQNTSTLRKLMRSFSDGDDQHIVHQNKNKAER